MSPETLESFRHYAVAAKEAAYENVTQLKPLELSAYKAVRDANVLIEQEKISQPYIEASLRKAFSMG